MVVSPPFFDVEPSASSSRMVCREILQRRFFIFASVKQRHLHDFTTKAGTIR